MDATIPNPLLFLFFSFSFSFFSSCFSLRTVVVDESRNFARLPLSPLVGPESIAFDPQGEGPYTGVSDGRILKWEEHLRGWREFAVPPRRRGVTRALCLGSNSTAMEDKCGRPLGIQFHRATGDLYIADAYYGLLMVGRRGGVATQLAVEAEGVPFKMTNGVDIDQVTGIVYFTDSSTTFARKDWVWAVLMADATGRFMRYDPRTKQVQVLLRGIEFANGVALSKDSTFVLVGESTKQRVLKYWLKGQKAGKVEVFANTPGFPDNIRRNSKGEFWVGINTGKGKIEIQGSPGMDEVPMAHMMNPGVNEVLRAHSAGETVPSGTGDTVAMRFDAGGAVMDMLNDKRELSSLSEVQEHNGSLWLGSAVTPYLGIYRALV